MDDEHHTIVVLTEKVASSREDHDYTMYIGVAGNFSSALCPVQTRSKGMSAQMREFASIELN